MGLCHSDGEGKRGGGSRRWVSLPRLSQRKRMRFLGYLIVKLCVCYFGCYQADSGLHIVLYAPIVLCKSEIPATIVRRHPPPSSVIQPAIGLPESPQDPRDGTAQLQGREEPGGRGWEEDTEAPAPPRHKPEKPTRTTDTRPPLVELTSEDEGV